MKNIIRFIRQCLTRKHRQKQEFKARLKAADLSLIYSPDTAIYLGCLGYFKSEDGFWQLRRGGDGSGDLIGEFPNEKSAKAEFDRLIKEAEEREVDLDEILDEISKRIKNINNIAKANYIRKSLKRNVDLLNRSSKKKIFRANPDDLGALRSFARRSPRERRQIIENVNIELRESGSRYKVENAKDKGYKDIPLSENGTSSDFRGTKYLYNDKSVVKIQITGSRKLDFDAAFEKMGITNRSERKRILKDYTWHHLDDLDENLGCTMQLIEKEAHVATYKHFGSAAQAVKAIGLTEYLT